MLFKLMLIKNFDFFLLHARPKRGRLEVKMLAKRVLKHSGHKSNRKHSEVNLEKIERVR